MDVGDEINAGNQAKKTNEIDMCTSIQMLHTHNTPYVLTLLEG